MLPSVCCHQALSASPKRSPLNPGPCAPLQVWRWSQQYRSQVLGEPLAEMGALAAWLGAHVPDQDADPAATRISHGDYRCRRPVLVALVGHDSTIWSSCRSSVGLLRGSPCSIIDEAWLLHVPVAECGCHLCICCKP